MQIHQDIQELNRLLFEELEDNLKDTNERDLINDLYKGCLKTTIQCLNCGKISERNDEFQDVNLSVSDCDSIEVALDNHTQTETLAGDNQYFCEICKSRVDAIKKSKFIELPPILTLSLSRFYFNYESMEAEKLDKMCSFPLHLDMTAHLANNQDEPVIYDLFSIVIHVGTAACDGHYHAYIKEPYGYIPAETKDQTTGKDSFVEQAQSNTNYSYAKNNEQWKPSSVRSTPQMGTPFHQYLGEADSYDLNVHPIRHSSRTSRGSVELMTHELQLLPSTQTAFHPTVPNNTSEVEKCRRRSETASDMQLFRTNPSGEALNNGQPGLDDQLNKRKSSAYRRFISVMRTNLKADGRSTSSINGYSEIKSNRNHFEEVLYAGSESTSRRTSEAEEESLTSSSVKGRVRTSRRSDTLRSNKFKEPQSLSFDQVEMWRPRLFRQTSTPTKSSISDSLRVSSNTLNEGDKSTNHSSTLEIEDSFEIQEDLNNAMDCENPNNVKELNGRIDIEGNAEKVLYGKWFDFNDDVFSIAVHLVWTAVGAAILERSFLVSSMGARECIGLSVVPNKLDPSETAIRDVGDQWSVVDTDDGSTKTKHHNPCLKFLKDNWFTLATVAGVGLGFGVAFIIRATKPGAVALTWISMPADIYLRLLQLMILPLISSSILVAIATMDLKKEGKVGLIGIIYIILIDLICSCLGTAFALIIKPGSWTLVGSGNENPPVSISSGLTVSDIFRDVLFNIFPDNLISITIYHYQTEFDAATNTTQGNYFKSGTNMTGVLFCSIVFGAAAKVSGDIASVFVNFFRGISTIVTKIMTIFLLVTPVAVVFMVASSIAGRDNIESEFVQLGLFVATVLVALAIHFFILIIVYFLASRKNPLRLLKYSSQAFFLAFATTSPALALPEIYSGLDRYGVRQHVSRLIGPLTATLKGDGPAAFISASAIFVAQNEHTDLNVGQIFTIIVLTFIASLAVPSIPSASVVLVMTVLSAIGVPTERAALLFAMEWLLDRCRSGSGALGMMFIPATAEAIAESLDRKKKLEENFDDDISPV
nr:excitatory amino acid transporter 2 [Hymenolepis microstoma]